MHRTASEIGTQVDMLLGCARENFKERLAPDSVEAHAVVAMSRLVRTTARRTKQSATAGASALGQAVQ
jgi:hypothetical protein